LAGASSIANVFSHWKFQFFALGVLRDLYSGAWKIVRTCNVGLHLDDLEAIGGFDESFVGWGREDSDFVVRLIRNGVSVRSGRLAVCVAHLHHPERARDKLSENDARFDSCINDPTRIHSRSSVLIQP